jgi:hypothetical protein
MAQIYTSIGGYDKMDAVRKKIPIVIYMKEEIPENGYI